MSEVVSDNSSVWYPIIHAIQLANWCDAAAVALVCYDSVLMFPREVQYIWRKPWSMMSTFYVIARYLGIALALGFWALNANISMAPSTYVTAFYHTLLVNQGRTPHFWTTDVGVAVDKFVNFGAFAATIVGDVIMCIRLYAMYLGAKLILWILVATILCRIGVGLAVAVVIFGPNSGVSATEWILSGTYVCGPSVSTASSLPVAWDIMAVVVNALLFFLAVGRFIKHALEMRKMSKSWKANELMKVLVVDSIIYFSLNLLATTLLMISVWGVPNNAGILSFGGSHHTFSADLIFHSQRTFFAIVSAYTQNESSVLIPRLVISFRENYAEEERRREGVDTAGRTFRNTKMEFKRRVTGDFEMQTADQAAAELSSGGSPEVEEVPR